MNLGSARGHGQRLQVAFWCPQNIDYGRVDGVRRASSFGNSHMLQHARACICMHSIYHEWASTIEWHTTLFAVTGKASNIQMSFVAWQNVVWYHTVPAQCHLTSCTTPNCMRWRAAHCEATCGVHHAMSCCKFLLGDDLSFQVMRTTFEAQKSAWRPAVDKQISTSKHGRSWASIEWPGAEVDRTECSRLEHLRNDRILHQIRRFFLKRYVSLHLPLPLLELVKWHCVASIRGCHATTRCDGQIDPILRYLAKLCCTRLT